MCQVASQRGQLRLILAVLLVSFCGLYGCGTRLNQAWTARAKPGRVLEMMSLSWQKNALFERNFLTSFGKRNAIETQFVPNLETVNSRLSMYQQLLRAHSSQPDLLQIDVVWPAILADDLVDLRPYLKPEANTFSPELLENYTVRGRLVALPTFIDMGVLYYRPELLAEYGFAKPPATWEELEGMAKRIQTGERRRGNKDFWGYVWQGGAFEGLTCNALEWQSSSGAGTFIEPSGTVHVRSAAFASVLRRAAGWIGTISPPGEFVYREPDSVNLWNAGQTAFMRAWASSYGYISQSPGNDGTHFAVAALPGGPGGQRETFGGLAIAVSKYAANRDLAIKAVLEVTNESHDLDRLLTVGGIPTHTTVRERPDVRSRTLLLAVSQHLFDGLVARPSLVAGAKYDQVSREYSAAVNSILRRKAQPEAAMAELEKKLMEITGLPAQRD